MTSPFRIIPSTGYLNSQFQVISSVDDIEVEITSDTQISKRVVLSKENPATITGMSRPGEYLAKCIVNGEEHRQKIIVEDAVRLGSSILKAAYLFDDSDYVFLVMKDRLVLYNQSTDQIITENNLSPTSIKQIDQENFLFLTKAGDKDEQISNLGIFNTTQLRITDELLNSYQKILINQDVTRIWLKEINSKDIFCYSPLKTGVFKRIEEFDAVQNHKLSTDHSQIIIEQEKSISVIDALSLSKISEKKRDGLAVDNDGFIYGIFNKAVYSYGPNSKKNLYYPLPEQGINLFADRFLWIGSDLKMHFSDKVWIDKYNELKQQLPAKKPGGNTYERILLAPEEVVVIDSYVDSFFSTDSGVYHYRISTKKKLLGVTFNGRQGEWYPREYFSVDEDKKLIFHDKESVEIPGKINSAELFGPFLFTKSYYDQKYYLKNHLVLKFPAIANLTNIRTSTNKNFVLQKEGDYYSLFNLEKGSEPVLQNIQIHNKTYFDNFFLRQLVIWYGSKGDNNLMAYDLLRDRHLALEEKVEKNYPLKINSHFNFHNNYFSKYGSEILIHPITGEAKDSVPGHVVAVSKSLNKVVSRRKEEFYLSVFDNTSTKYIEKDLPLDIDTFSESYLSPDGRFLMLQKNSDNYHLYDIPSGEVVKFFSGKFLSFSKEGNLIFEEDERRNTAIYDPNTFEKISSSNFHYYRFKSPDGKLYSQVSSKVRYYNKIKKEDMTGEEVTKFAKKLNLPTPPRPDAPSEEIQQYKSEERSIKNYRQVFYNTYTHELIELGIEKPDDLNSSLIIDTIKYTEIGITGTTETVEIRFPDDLTFFNYAAFSYDDKYFGYVGKPSSDGLISLHKLNFDEENLHLQVESTYQTRKPDKATWICAFSKKGQFATYDSRPNTYLINCNDSLFQKMEKNESPKQEWDIRNGKSFLCFSSSGNFIALSDQGYNPITLGGNGHKESSLLQIGQSHSPEILQSFRDHGDEMKVDKKKHIIFVAFAEDEKKIMSLSKDGVVLVRNLNLV